MPKTSTSIIAATVTALCVYFGTGLHPHWWMTWLAAVPVLALAYRAAALPAFLVSFFAFLIGELNLWGYFSVLEIPFPIRCLALVGIAAIFAAGVLLSRALYRRGHSLLATFALPTVFVAFEFANSFGRNGTALNFAYSQMDCLPLLQLASVTGVWGISFVVLFFSSMLAQLLFHPESPRKLAIVSATVFLAIFAFGTLRLKEAPEGRDIRIGLAASDQRPLLGTETKASALLASYENSITELTKQGAGVIVLPEKIFTTNDFQSSGFHKRLRELAIQNAVGMVTAPGQVSLTDSIVIVAGVDQQDTPLKHNLAFALSPLHESTYEKHHMVVSWEDGYEVGSKALLLPSPNAELGVAICKDMDFPRLSRTYAELGAQLMLIPAWDFEVDDWLHSRMAIMRSVESGFAMARSAKQGFMTINDDRGRVLFERRSDATGSAHLIGNIRLYGSHTLYARFGDWFAWLNLAALAFLLFSLRTVREQLTDD